MKNKSKYLVPLRGFLPLTALLTVIGLTATLKVQAASQTWTNAPTDNSWTNVLNWNLRAVPGAVNVTGNTVNGDIATFTNSIPISGIGGSGAVDKGILPDASSNATRAREIAGITFDGTTCGAYFIGTNGMTVPLAGGTPASGCLVVSHNGAIRVNPAVANNQTILEPLAVILPSGTPGIFNLVNNSTNGAALIISYIQHGGANTRGTTFILDGTNTANNIVTNLSEGTSAGTAGNGGGITKQGSCTWTIAGPGTFIGTSVLTVNQGTLVVQDAGAFGASTATVNSNGVLLVQNGITLTPAATTTIQRNGTIKVNGSTTLNGVTVGTAASGTSPNLVTTGSGDVMTIGNALNKMTGGAADSTIHVAGPGTVSLAFDANYIGKWSVDAGKLALSTASGLGTGANVNIAAGGTLNITLLGATTWNPTTTGIGGSGTGTTVGSTAGTLLADAAAIIDLATGTKAVNLTITPTSFSGDATHPALYVSQGTLSMGGNAFSINNAGGTALGVGTYSLIQQASGSITDGGGYSVVGVTGSGVSAGNVASIVVSGGNVNLVVSPYTPKNLVWSGTGSIWDIATTSDWLNGVSSSVFNNSDNVTFNSVGAANLSVTLSGTISPGSVTVNADSTTNYTLTGGQMAGSASLTKKGTGTLLLNQANTYGGGTVISNGVLRVGIANAVPSSGAGNVSVISPGVLDLNTFSDSINALIGSGTVDTVAGGASILTVGNNDASGTFSGVLQNTAGTLGLTKVGTGTETLTAANTYSGATTMNLGGLVLSNLSAVGSSALTVNAGSVDVQTSLNLASLAGSGGGIANSTVNPVTITVNGSAATTFSGFIWDGAGGGNIALKILGTTSLTLGGNNTYTGGTYVGSGATFAIPNGGAPNNANVSGFLIASNLATLSLSGTSTSPGTPTNVLTVDGATVSFTSSALGKIWGGQFQGSANTTNRILNQVSFGGDTSFKNFNGVVNFEAATGNARFINIPAGTAGGGDAATFNWPAGGGMAVVTRDAATVRLGEIRGGSSICGIDQATTAGVLDTYLLGGKNVNCNFEGFFRGINNLVKIGSAQLAFDGFRIATNTDSLTYTNYLYSPLVTHIGFTTISNGVLALVSPNNLLTSSNITLAGVGAVLDASAMGYVSNFTDVNGANSKLVTNSLVEMAFGTVLNGIGTIRGSLIADAGSTLNPGNTTGNIATGTGTGILAVTNAVDIAGAAVNVQLNRGNAVTSDEISAGSTITVNGGTLTVTNVGSDLVTGDVFHLFNKGITGSGFTTISLPVQNLAATITYVYQTNLVTAGSSPAGTIKVLTGASAIANYSTNITATVTGGGTGITVAWPATHLGWELMLQTNTLTTGLGNNWVTNYGTASVTSTNYPINPANGTVFYRLVHP